MVERAEDAALLLLLLEQGIDDDDNIIPNAVVVPLDIIGLFCNILSRDILDILWYSYLGIAT